MGNVRDVWVYICRIADVLCVLRCLSFNLAIFLPFSLDTVDIYYTMYKHCKLNYM